MQPIAIPSSEPMPRVAVAGSEAAQRAPVPADVGTLSSAGEFGSLAHDWELLNAASGKTGVFNSWMWHFAWWDAHRQGRALKIVVARRAGAVIGILPLYMQRARYCGVAMRVLRLLGTHDDKNSYNVAPLFERGSAELAARALAHAVLGMRDFDILQLADVDAGNPLAAAVVEAAAQRSLRCEVERSRRLVTLGLPGAWNAYLRSLSSQQRARIRHRRHALNAAHRAYYFVWHTATSIDAMLATLVALRRMRTAVRRAMSAPVLAALSDAFEEQRVRLYCLQIEGRVAAAVLALRWRERVVVMQTEFDPQYAGFHPVSVLLQFAIESAMAEGATAFDFVRDQADFDDELVPQNERVGVTAFRTAVGAAAFRAQKTLVKAAGLGRLSKTAPC
jgi:CelD/BcsL family acetyltransferase involved in cellulose biosynthesis